jgi:WD40 repeat protein
LRHTGAVICLTIHENKLYSGSDDTIRIWAGTHTENYEEIATLEGHTERLRCLTHHENKLVSGSLDKTIRIWKV